MKTPYTVELAEDALLRGARQMLGYMAGPMSADPEGYAMKAAHLSRNLTQRFGVQFFVPHGCVLLQKYAPRSVEEWLEMDGAILSRCDFVYMMDGWEDSIGARAEYRFGNLPTICSPGELKGWLMLKANARHQGG